MDIQINKDLEQELSKQCKYYQMTIKKLKTKTEDLENQKKLIDENRMNISTDEKEINGETVNQSDEEMINYLEQKLEQIEK